MNRITPLHLKTLHTIARLGTFQAAAERLNTTQPGISARMRELEAQLGTALFQRQGRQMSLTARARQLVLETEPVLAMLDRALIRAADTSFATGTVRIGTGEIASVSCVPAFVRQTQARFPHVALEIEVDLTALMLEALLSGRSDMVFLAGPVAHPGIVTTSLGTLELIWLARPEVARAAQADIPQTIWSLPAHSPLHGVVRAAIAQRVIACRTLSTCNNVRTLCEIVMQGGGVGLFPETMTRDQRDTGDLVEVYPRPSAHIEFQAAIRKRESDPLILELFTFASSLAIDPTGL